MEKMSNRAAKREKGQAHTHTHTYIYIYIHTDSFYMSPVEPQKKSLHFLSHSLLIEITYHDCSVICFSEVSRAGESLFYMRVRPQGSKQRQPVFLLSSSALISCVVVRVSLIPPDSCHSPSQCTIVDSDTHRLPHQNAAAMEHTLSHP